MLSFKPIHRTSAQHPTILSPTYSPPPSPHSLPPPPGARSFPTHSTTSVQEDALCSIPLPRGDTHYKRWVLTLTLTGPRFYILVHTRKQALCSCVPPTTACRSPCWYLFLGGGHDLRKLTKL